MTDIIDKIRDIAPSEIDNFEKDMTRRAALTNDILDKFLRDTFYGIDSEHLTPATSWSWNQLHKRIESAKYS
jgi:hypothetical protein